MNCDDARLLTDAHIDRELDPATDREVSDHLRTCTRCTQEAETTRALKASIGAGENRFQAPAALRSRIENAIGGNRATEPAREAPAVRRERWMLRLSTISLPTAIAALLAIFFATRMFAPGDGDFILREVVAAHVRSTQVDHLTDVASTDRHTVKPWFEGKIDFSPPVADFQAQGFKLTGGRVDYLDDRAVAALVYAHGPHVINVFVWPSSSSEQGPAMTVRSGYNVDHFVHAGMNYWIVSDTSPDEMQKLAALLRG